MQKKFDGPLLRATLLILACCLFIVYTSPSLAETLGSLLVFGAIFLAVFLLLLPPLIKVQILKAVSENITIAEATPESFPLLDSPKLASITQEMAELGFREMRDFTVKNEGEKMIPTFTRSWIHQDGTCYAEASQYFAPQKATPMILIFLSYFGDGPPSQPPPMPVHAPLPVPGAPDSSELEKQAAALAEWTYTTTDAPHRTLMRLLRRPRYLNRRLTNASTRQLYETHKADRAKIAAHLQLPVAENLTFQRYTYWAILARRAYRYQLRHRNIYLALWRALFNKSDEWWGELSQIMPSENVH